MKRDEEFCRSRHDNCAEAHEMKRAFIVRVPHRTDCNCCARCARKTKKKSKRKKFNFMKILATELFFFFASVGRKRTTHSKIFIMPFSTQNNIQTLIDAHLMMLFASFQFERGGRQHFYLLSRSVVRFRTQIVRGNFNE